MNTIAAKSVMSWLGVLLLAGPCCVAAHAQQASSNTGSADSSGGAASAPQSADDTDVPSDRAAEVLPAITVTANRRAVPLQTAPISATVVSGGTLNDLHINLVDQLQFISPSTTVNNFGQGNDFNIRGIGKGEHNTQTGTGVITYWNGVPAFPGYVNEQPYYDIASIQILRGPQGTFGGENATGGAVLVKTNTPALHGGVGGYVQGQVGNYGEIGTQGAVNLPISDTLAARIAFYGNNRDSFYNVTGPWTGDTRKRFRSARFSLLWKPNENLSVTSINYYGYFNNGALIGSPVGPGYPPITDPFEVESNAELESLDHMVRSILKVDYKFDNGYEFRSITGYQRGATKWRTDLDGTAVLNNIFRDSVYETMPTQEFDLLSPKTGRLSWIVGTFWQWNKYTFPTGKFVSGPAGNPAAQYILQGVNSTWNRAVFGQIEYDLTDDLELAVGARYTQAQTTNHVFVEQFGTPIPDDQVARFHNVSGKISLGWTVNDKNYLYALVSEGFKPGGLNVPVAVGLVPDPFDSEKVVSQEIGWKGKWADDHVRLQLDFYQNHYKNFQLKVGYPALPTFGFELNVPNPTTMYGAEAQLQALVGDWSLFANVGWMHSSLGRFFATDTRLPSVLPCDTGSGPASSTCIDLEGRQQTYAPNLTYGLGLQYTFHAGSDTVVPRVNFAHISPQWATLFENVALGDRLGERNILGASLDWNHGSWVTSLYGTNLTNQHYVSANLIGSPGFLYYGPPRQYGIRVTKYF